MAAAIVFASTDVQAEAPPQTLHCGQVITTDVTLTRDLVGCAGDGLIVAAPDVTINLNQHRIVGGTAANTAAVRDRGYGRLKVVRGTLTGFDLGIDFETAGGLVVTGTSVLDSATFGILLVQADGAVVAGNTVRGAIGSGIQVASSNNNLFVANTLLHNGDGFALYQSSHNLIVGNQSSNSGAGIDLVQSTYNAILRNSTDHEQDTGILLDDHADHNTITQNEGSANSFAGIAVGASDGNLISNNRENGNLGSGLAVVDDATRTVVSGNEADRNGGTPPGCVPDCPLLDDGIHVDAPGTTLTGNRADGNADLGIDAVAGVVDGGRNTALHNGDQRECTQVVCR